MNRFQLVLSEYEMRVLRVCAGEPQSGIAPGEKLDTAIELLTNLRLVETRDGVYVATPKGQEVLNAPTNGEKRWP